MKAIRLSQLKKQYVYIIPGYVVISNHWLIRGSCQAAEIRSSQGSTDRLSNNQLTWSTSTTARIYWSPARHQQPSSRDFACVWYSKRP